MQEEARVAQVRIRVQVVNAPRVEGRRAPDKAVHGVSLCEQQLGEVRSVLSRDARDEGYPTTRGVRRIVAFGGHGFCSDALLLI